MWYTPHIAFNLMMDNYIPSFRHSIGAIIVLCIVESTYSRGYGALRENYSSVSVAVELRVKLVVVVKHCTYASTIRLDDNDCLATLIR